MVMQSAGVKKQFLHVCTLKVDLEIRKADH